MQSSRKLRISAFLLTPFAAAFWLSACGSESSDEATASEQSGLGEDGAGGRADAPEGDHHERPADGDDGAHPEDGEDRGEDGQAVADCRHRAHRAAQEVLDRCRDHGGRRGACALRARHAAHRVAAMCAPGGHHRDDHHRGEDGADRGDRDEHDRPHLAQCVIRCEHHAREVGEACHADGGEAEACREAARDAMHTCVEAHCEQPVDRPPPPPPADECRERCGAAGRDLDRRCNEEGGEPERCRAHAVEFVNACVEEHCGGGDDRPDEPPPPPPEGEDRPDQPPPPPEGDGDVCAERCGAHGRELHRACLEAGGDDEACAARAREAVGACIEANCGGGDERPDEPPPPPPPEGEERPDEPPPPPPEGDACADRCGAHGRELHRACLEAGGSEEECLREAHEAVGACIERNCGGGAEEPPPPPPPPADACTEEDMMACREASMAAAHDCAAAGGTREECGAAAHEAGAACMAERCPAPAR